MTIQNWAVQFVLLSENSEGRIDLNRVNAVLNFIENQIPMAIRMKVLREYKRRMRIKVDADAAFVEFAGELDESSKSKIRDFIISKNPKSAPQFIENKDLIAGLKITVGDTVYENSLKMKLQDLAKSLGA